MPKVPESRVHREAGCTGVCDHESYDHAQSITAAPVVGGARTQQGQRRAKGRREPRVTSVMDAPPDRSAAVIAARGSRPNNVRPPHRPRTSALRVAQESREPNEYARKRPHGDSPGVCRAGEPDERRYLNALQIQGALGTAPIRLFVLSLGQAEHDCEDGRAVEDPTRELLHRALSLRRQAVVSVGPRTEREVGACLRTFTHIDAK
jgi:hypothetical protein